MTHQKRQNIGDSSGNRLFLDWFITEDTMKKRPDSFFNFLFGQERIGRLFDRDACWSGPTNYFVGFQRFTQIFTRNTRKLDVRQKIFKET